MAFFSIIQKNPYADLYLMENEHLKVFLTNFGAAIFSVQFKNNDSKLTELTLSCNTLKDFVKILPISAQQLAALPTALRTAYFL